MGILQAADDAEDPQGGMVVFDNVHMSYPTRQGTKHVFRGLSAVFPARRRVGILGRNGAGKSTLLSLVCGALEPDYGRIVRPTGSVSWPIGLVGVTRSHLTAVDNIRFVSRIYGVDWRDVFDYVADFSELGRDLWNPISTYSGGMRQRFNVGLALAIQFDWYLMDEALSAGDPRFRERTAQALAARVGQVSLLMVSHVPRNVRQYCDTAALLLDGRLYFFDDTEEAIRAYNEM